MNEEVPVLMMELVSSMSGLDELWQNLVEVEAMDWMPTYLHNEEAEFPVAAEVGMLDIPPLNSFLPAHFGQVNVTGDLDAISVASEDIPEDNAAHVVGLPQFDVFVNWFYASSSFGEGSHEFFPGTMIAPNFGFAQELNAAVAAIAQPQLLTDFAENLAQINDEEWLLTIDDFNDESTYSELNLESDFELISNASDEDEDVWFLAPEPTADDE
ncbi:hypothetical protein HDU96_009356 [Phlyctochytrium bullatum]|nr:hypothetical protein HDU96_009356 [Phlyctochytrium bullatum]